MARAAVAAVEHVNSVRSDVNRHTVTVDFEDETVKLKQIIETLDDAGYTVGEPVRLQ